MTSFKYKTLVNCENGIWNTNSDEEHIQDRKLTKGIIDFFKDNKAKSVVDLGCGAGYYVKSFREQIPGIVIDGYDGNPNTPTMTNNMCGIKDLSIPFTFENKYEWVMSLEVGEHLPKKYEQIFIDNLCNNCSQGIILSWAVKGQGGSGHFNEQDNQYVKNQIEKRGFYNDIEAESILRSDCSLRWFRNTTMIFIKEN